MNLNWAEREQHSWSCRGTKSSFEQRALPFDTVNHNSTEEKLRICRNFYKGPNVAIQCRVLKTMWHFSVPAKRKHTWLALVWCISKRPGKEDTSATGLPTNSTSSKEDCWYPITSSCCTLLYWVTAWVIATAILTSKITLLLQLWWWLPALLCPACWWVSLACLKLLPKLQAQKSGY